METIILKVDVGVAGNRLDSYIASQVEALSRAAVQRLLVQENVLVNDKIERASYRVATGDTVHVNIPAPVEVDIMPEDIPLDILYEDPELLVINKPAGLVVHPGAGNFSGTLVNAILFHCPDLQGVGGELRPGIVHRLDKLTSGVLVIAKTDMAIRGLQRQFQRREVTKHYQALVHGHVPQESGYIDAPIARHPSQRKKMAIVSRGKPARTQWSLVQRYHGPNKQPYALLDVNLLTGRTHQIRVHLAWLGYPVAGDVVYGHRNAAFGLNRQWLHAYSLEFVHPLTRQSMTFIAPLPAELTDVLAQLTVSGR